MRKKPLGGSGGSKIYAYSIHEYALISILVIAYVDFLCDDCYFGFLEFDYAGIGNPTHLEN